MKALLYVNKDVYGYSVNKYSASTEDVTCLAAELPTARDAWDLAERLAIRNPHARYAPMPTDVHTRLLELGELNREHADDLKPRACWILEA